ncbi:MAG: 5-(carboxyamino)imidazole ribonucleotide synthase [Rhodothermales bacterium]|nr:5-(carboxyamino)imidazole ribonucleotide synthase [Rhodothermales bacterium]
MTLGILGGGQLGRMLGFAALRMGLDVRFLVNEPSDSVACFADVTVADWNDPDVLRAFADGCDAVTVESEWAPADRLAEAAPGVAVWPSPETLHLVQNKGRQREAFAHLPQPEYVWARTYDEAEAALETLGLPLVAKRLEGSYDGYGNATVREADALRAAWDALATDDGLLLEAFVPFEAEAAVIVCRGDGDGVVYPMLFTEQRDHRCHAVAVPSGFSASVEQKAREVAMACATALGVRGLLAVELFVTSDGEVLVNEVAPRPHNSGHLTIEACVTSQFENHARAVLGLPLGASDLRVPAAAMVNVFGHTDGPIRLDSLPSALEPLGPTIHLYGKRTSRPRRKLGHVTATAAAAAEAYATASEAAARLRL